MTLERVRPVIRLRDPGYGLADLGNDLYGLLSWGGVIVWTYVLLRLTGHI